MARVEEIEAVKEDERKMFAAVRALKLCTPTSLRIVDKEAELATASLLRCRYSLTTSTASLHLSHIHPFLPPTFDLGASCHT